VSVNKPKELSVFVPMKLGFPVGCHSVLYRSRICIKSIDKSRWECRWRHALFKSTTFTILSCVRHYTTLLAADIFTHTCCTYWLSFVTMRMSWGIHQCCSVLYETNRWMKSPSFCLCVCVCLSPWCQFESIASIQFSIDSDGGVDDWIDVVP